jgi:hypothetical protein
LGVGASTGVEVSDAGSCGAPTDPISGLSKSSAKECGATAKIAKTPRPRIAFFALDFGSPLMLDRVIKA